MVCKYRVWDSTKEQLYIGLDLRSIVSRVAIPNNNAFAVEAIKERPEDMKWLQFTGFTHKGVEIYDKDILRFTNPAPGSKWRKSHGDRDYNDMVVSWNKQRGMWAVYWQNADGELYWSSLSKALTDQHSIAGNVYQNPELVK